MTNIKLKAMGQPIRHRLLIPLTIVLTLLLLGFGMIIIMLQQNYLQQSGHTKAKNVFKCFKTNLNEQGYNLTALGKVLLQNSNLHSNLKSYDRKQLLADYEAIFMLLREQYGITHFYFHKSNRVNLLRVHKPEKSGDLIDRFTLKKSERTGKVATGIELGVLGTFTIRMVQPIFNDEILMGYLELGKEIEDTLFKLQHRYKVEVAITIRKHLLKQKEWEAGMQMLGREAHWKKHSGDVLIYSSLPHFPSECNRFVHGEKDHQNDTIQQVFFNHNSWQVMVKSFMDVSGVEVGDLIILRNVSKNRANFKTLLITVLGATFAILAILFWFLYFTLLRTDRYIHAQQTKLSENESKLHNILRQSKEKAEAANNAKNIFLRNLSHELRTPLTTIMGYAQLISKDTTLDSKYQEQINNIYHQGEKILVYFNKMVDLSKNDKLLKMQTQIIAKDYHLEKDTISAGLSQLPLDLLNALKLGAEITSPKDTAAAILQIDYINKNLAQALTNLLKAYRFDIMQTLLEKV